MQHAAAAQQRASILCGERGGDVRQVPGRLGAEEGLPGDPPVHGHEAEDQAGERQAVEAVSER